MNRDVLIVVAMVVLFILNIPFYLYLGKRFFGDWAGFQEAVDFWFTPDIVSAWRGRFHDDIWAELKLWVFFVICAVILAIEYVCVFLLSLWLMDKG